MMPSLRRLRVVHVILIIEHILAVPVLLRSSLPSASFFRFISSCAHPHQPQINFSVAISVCFTLSFFSLHSLCFLFPFVLLHSLLLYLFLLFFLSFILFLALFSLFRFASFFFVIMSLSLFPFLAPFPITFLFPLHRCT